MLATSCNTPGYAQLGDTPNQCNHQAPACDARFTAFSKRQAASRADQASGQQIIGAVAHTLGVANEDVLQTLQKVKVHRKNGLE